MADAKLTALTAASALAGADLFYVSQSAASRKATGTQLLALVGTTYVPLAGGTMTGALTIASGTLTASAPALSVTQTWNGAGVTFFGLDLSFTNTAIADAYPINVKVGGSSIFYLRYNGAANFVQNVSALNFLSTSGAIAFGENYGIRVGSATSFSWTSATATSGTTDLFIVRDAAATLAQRNGTTQQIFRLYNSYTDSSNFERLTLTGVAGASVNLTAESAGTGSANLDFALTPKGSGSIVLNGSVNKIASNSAFRTGNSDGTGHLYLDVSKLVLRRGNAGTFTSLIFTGATSANVALVPVNSILSVRLGDDSGYATLNSGINNVFDYQQFAEVTAPSAPTTNSVRIYAEDNGAGKTRLMALFATGAAQQISIEP